MFYIGKKKTSINVASFPKITYLRMFDIKPYNIDCRYNSKNELESYVRFEITDEFKEAILKYNSPDLMINFHDYNKEFVITRKMMIEYKENYKK